MLEFSFVLAVLTCFIVQVLSDDYDVQYDVAAPGPGDCKTKTGEKCEFPFIYKGVTYYGCTYRYTGNGKPWCATKVRSQLDRTAVPGKTGDCDTSICYLFEADPCITVSGPDAGNSCKFPFIYENITYSSCTEYTSSGPENVRSNYGKSWCSTMTDRYHNHLDGEGRYGFCDSSCPGYQPTQRTTPTPWTRPSPRTTPTPWTRPSPRTTRTTRTPTNSQECKTLPTGGVPNTNCVFPFIYKRRIYNSCIKYTSLSPDYVRGSPDEGKFWCSTSTRNGEFIPGNYGFCGIGKRCFQRVQG